MDSVTLAILEDDAVLVKVLLAEFDEGLVPRVLLLDIGLPGLSGTEMLPLLKDKYPALEVIMFTAYEDVEHVYQALCCGATGYLTKGTSLDQLKAGVLEVARGGAPMSRGVGRKVLGHFRPIPTTHPVLLTSRERQVLQGITDGLSDKEISTRLDLSTLTVRTHVKHVYRKMQVNSRTQLLSQHLRGLV